MGTKYSSNSISGYNSSPPADDGTVSEANKVKWSTIKTKITDPVKTLAETINSELATHFDNGPTAITTATTLDATHYNQVIEASGTSEITLTDAATLTAGWYCDIINTGAGNVPILRATASDTIDEVSADITLFPLDSIRVIVNAGADGFVTMGRGAKANKGSDVASATALAVPNNGDYFDVTGTTTITSIDSVGIGKKIKLHFDGALTLTHHATNLVLPGGANITTAAGDEAEFVEYGAGTWRCTNYERASGQSIIPSAVSVSVIKQSQESVTSSTTLQDDDELTITLAANTLYSFESVVYFTKAASGPDAKMLWVAADGSFEVTVFKSSDTSSPGDTIAGGLNEATAAQVISTFSGAGDITYARSIGHIHTGGAGGAFKLQWAPNTSTANALNVEANSYMKATKIGTAV